MKIYIRKFSLFGNSLCLTDGCIIYIYIYLFFKLIMLGVLFHIKGIIYCVVNECIYMHNKLIHTSLLVITVHFICDSVITMDSSIMHDNSLPLDEVMSAAAEPPMYLQRPSSARSQDISHILAKTFRQLFMRDTVDTATVKNLNQSKGGLDEYHETYVMALNKVTI